MNMVSFLQSNSQEMHLIEFPQRYLRHSGLLKTASSRIMLDGTH